MFFLLLRNQAVQRARESSPGTLITTRLFSHQTSKKHVEGKMSDTQMRFKKPRAKKGDEVKGIAGEEATKSKGGDVNRHRTKTPPLKVQGRKSSLPSSDPSQRPSGRWRMSGSHQRESGDL
ncbi:uncharacterized protein LOC144021025 [Festucalex cinctus]